MALVLIKEDGAAKADANSYAAVADGDAYHDGHLYATAWSGATAASKASALVMATRVIDALFQFNGLKVKTTQALQWPRIECRDPDGTEHLSETAVPGAIIDATCELARELIKADRTEDPDGTGLNSMTLEGSLRLVFDTVNRQPVLTALIETMLSKYGQCLARRSGTVRLVRT